MVIKTAAVSLSTIGANVGAKQPFQIRVRSDLGDYMLIANIGTNELWLYDVTADKPIYRWKADTINT